MSKNSFITKLITLFVTFFKIGLFTFGGGYAMIPIIQKEVIENKKWISEFELLDIIAIAESTPGPIAVNMATYVGYKVGGVIGSIFATLGLATPSFIIIYLISLVYEDFMKITAVQNAFLGLKVGVIILLINAVIKLKKTIKFNLASTIVFLITLIAMVSFTIFNITIPSVTIIFIIMGLLFGIVFELITKQIKNGGNK